MNLFLFIVALLYFLPVVIAASRMHRNSVPILLLNLFLGWTFLGWLVCLVWAFSYQPRGDYK